ncbi:MAG: PIG-L domain-containing protein [Acidobacteria bacterium]|nr:MAG: PIG-L domain-containing protein [Acidobacteriota bacterium]
MLNVSLAKKKQRLHVLCLGSHSDDIEIGCGGTVLKLAGKNENVEVWWVVFSATGKRKEEASKSARSFLKSARRKEIIIKTFRDSLFPTESAKIKEFFEELKQRFQPDLIFTHYRNDRHQDHRTISDLTWNTFRNHLILEYEVPKYDGDLGSPNVFVHLDERVNTLKIKYILDNFKTQRQKHWFTRDTFLSLMRLRGVESGESQYAEAFYCRKLVMAP